MAHPFLTKKTLALALAVPLLGAATWAVIADEKAKGDETASVDARANEILQRFTRHIAGLDAYSTTIVQSMKMQSPFGNEDREEKFEFAVAKPNRFALTAADNDDSEAVVSDGKKLFIYMPMFGAYAEIDAPADIASLFKQVQNDTLMVGGLPAALLTPMFGPGGPDGDLGTVKSATYVGKEQVNGAEAHRVSLVIVPELTEDGRKRLRSEMGERANMIYYMDAWIDAGDEPRLHQVSLDLAKMLAEMMPEMFESMPQMSEMTYDMTMTFTDWKSGGSVSEDQFAFKAPEDADKVASMDELMAKMEAATAGPSGSPTDMLGKLAPEFEMQLLGGGTVTGEQHKGRDIVILDFWATWCVPCIRAMPDLMAVADAYKDRHVVFYAVNVRESPSDVEAFLKERQWSLKVPLDRDGSASNKFKVGGIPQTVVIDKDGTVQAVHVGFSPNVKSQLEGELDTLLRGDKLVESDD